MQLEILSNESLSLYTFLAWQEREDDPVKVNPKLLELLGVNTSPNNERYNDIADFLSDRDHHKTFGLKMVRLNEKTERIDLVVPKELTRPVIQSLRRKCVTSQTIETLHEGVITEPSDPRLKDLYESYLFEEITATQYRERAEQILRK